MMMTRKKRPNNSFYAPDEGACVFGADVLLKHLKALEEEVEGVRSGSPDIEYIHRARVATRRLRATFPLFEDCLPRKKAKDWLKRIRKVTKALGEARDADVQIERIEAVYQTLQEKTLKPGIVRLLLRLKQQRQQLQAAVQKNMDRLVKSQMIEEMHAALQPMTERAADVYLYTPALYQKSFHAIHNRLAEFMAYEEYVSQPEKAAELHQMRIAAKWLRYTLETFAPLYPNQAKLYVSAVKKMQEMLGDIHDCDVWQQVIPQFLADERQRTLDYFGNIRAFHRVVPGVLYFQNERQQARNAAYAEFNLYWAKCQEDNLWQELTRLIQMPFPQLESNLPPAKSSEPAEAAGTGPGATADASESTDSFESTTPEDLVEET